MKTFNDQFAQGDILITRIDELPDDTREVNAINGLHIVAHSETGHHHAMAAKNAKLYQSGNPMVLFLVVNKPTALKHHRSFDRHEPIMFDKGIYEIRRQREYTLEGWRRVED